MQRSSVDTRALGALLVVLVFAVYWPALSCGFIWDDDTHITKNPVLLGLSGLWAIWFQPGATAQYYPLTFSLFWIGRQLWALNPVGFHVLNVAMHAGVVLVFWRFLCKLRMPGAFAAAAVFALHPVNVMSVAWVTELKNTLSALLALGAGLAYLHFALTDTVKVGRKQKAVAPQRRWYATALVLFAFAMLAKTAVAFVPVTLLLIVWLRKGRIERRDATDLIPFFLLDAALGLMTIVVERRHGGDVGTAYALNLAERLIVSGRSFWFYLGKFVVPHPLVFIYPRWTITAHDTVQYLPAVATLGILLALFAARGRIGKGPFVALAHFWLATSALIFLVVTYFTRYSYVSDHWQYFGMMGVAALAGAGLAALPGGRAVTIGLCAVMAILTWRQCGVYRDEETLWNATIARNPGAWMAYCNLGTRAFERGDYARAEGSLREAYRLAPRDANTHFTLARTLLSEGKATDAAPLCEEERVLWPNDERTLEDLGLLALVEGKLDEAEARFTETLRLHSDSPTAHANLADILERQGRMAEARAHREALARILAASPGLWSAPTDEAR